MVRQVSTRDMPSGVPLNQVYDDVSLNLFYRRIQQSDPYFDDITSSGWDCAPPTPEKFDKHGLLTGEPVSDAFELDEAAGEAKPVVQDMPSKTQRMLKAIESTYGVGDTAESFTYQDLAENNDIPYNDVDTIRTPMNRNLKPENFVTEDSSAPGRQKHWVLVKSWKVQLGDE